MSSNSPSFEEMFARIEEILGKMNSGKVPLEESLKLYEEADRHLRSCQLILAGAQTKVEALLKTREGTPELDGNQKPITREFVPPRA